MGDCYARHICTNDDPWTLATAPQAIHPDATLVALDEECDGWPGRGTGDDRRRCPHCGTALEAAAPALDGR